MDDKNTDFKRFIRALNPAEIYTLFMLVLFSVLYLIFGLVPEYGLKQFAINIFVFILICYTAYLSVSPYKIKNLRLFRHIYLVPVIFIIYHQTQPLINAINPDLYDNVLIKWDFAIFGVNPTQWISRFSHPVLTEFLQIAYMAYFFMPLAIGIELHSKREEQQFDRFAALILFSFYSSYLLYFILPAVGPKFFLHDISAMDKELPGLWLTEVFREMIRNTDKIDVNSVFPAANAYRNCMPSGHTWITLITMIMAFRFHSKFRWIILFFGTALLFSTIYLWYHYVVDIFAGAALALLTLWLEPKLRKRIRPVRLP